MRYRFFFAVAVFSPLLVARSGPENAARSSPVQRRLAAAEKQIQANPKLWQGYNDLAFAFCRWARDNEDITLYQRAETALQHSFQLSPGNYEAEKLRVTVLLGKHEFAQALKSATELNHKVHDDIGGWGLLVDTNVAIGNYGEAERAAQWILDLRRGSGLGFIKAAGLRELFGDPEGAIEFFEEANLRTGQSDSDERAWLLTQIARLQLSAGNLKQAENLLGQALKLFPDSQLALANLAAVRMAQGNYAEAAAILEKRYRGNSTSANLYEWAEALERALGKDRALTAFRDFEIKAGAEVNGPYNSNRQLVFFYTDHKLDPAKALTLATKETLIRHDSATLDAYAWALYHNGKYSEARKEMDEALAVGVRNPVYFCHAAQIAAKTNDMASAARFQRDVAGPATNSCPIEQASHSARPVLQ